jgi:valyl-tRNA synthetase
MQPQMEKKIETQTKKDFPEGIAASGTDALRFTFCALATQGRNINFDLGRLAGYRNFCNKIWNATRFVLMSVGDGSVSVSKSIADRWILDQLQKTVDQAHLYFREYRFDQLAKLLYEFVWNDYCDWYLELSKCDLARDDISDTQKQGTKHTLLFVLENIMRLLHPIMPFITEEIWQKISPMLGIEGETIMMQPYPTFNTANADEKINHDMIRVQEIIIAIRTLRSEINLSPAKKITVILHNGSADDKKIIESNAHYISTLVKIDKLTWKNATETLPECATALSQQLEMHVPLAGLIDKDAELMRLKKEIEKCEKSKIQMESRLSNAAFTDKAPAEVVTKLREEFSAAQQTLKKLQEQHQKIEAL